MFLSNAILCIIVKPKEINYDQSISKQKAKKKKKRIIEVLKISEIFVLGDEVVF